MNYFFLTLGLSKISSNTSSIIAIFFALILGGFILIFLNETTLFLATLLLAVITIRAVNKYENNAGLHNDEHIKVDKFIGIGFALSVAPAIGVPLEQVSTLGNGFVLQALLSALFFLYFDTQKHSVIGRVYREAKGGISVVGDDVLAGFTAGIVSSLVWQVLLQVQTFFA